MGDKVDEALRILAVSGMEGLEGVFGSEAHPKGI